MECAFCGKLLAKGKLTPGHQVKIGCKECGQETTYAA